MATEASLEEREHTYLVQTLSAMMIQINALQTLTRDPAPADAGASLDIHTLRDGLTVLEQMAREILYELRAQSDDEPLAELADMTLDEALSRAVEETAEASGLSSRVVFSGEKRPLPGS